MGTLYTSPKHLHRYVSEFAFRLNDGDVSRHTMERLTSLFSAGRGYEAINPASLGRILSRCGVGSVKSSAMLRKGIRLRPVLASG